MRILPKERDSSEPTLGVEEGGLQSAEALLWARHFMYTQLYFHPVRRIYDIHLKEFLQAWLQSGKFSTNPKEHLRMTDNEVLSGMAELSADSEARGHDSARRIIRREHFKVLYKRNPTDQQRNKQSARTVFEAAEKHFGPGTVGIDEYTARSRGIDFPVWTSEDVESSLGLSETLAKVPAFTISTVYIRPDLRQTAKKWLNGNPRAWA